ncbi:MAG: hypothetical protein QW793_06265 [Candidatus Caldarchaeum sp.]
MKRLLWILLVISVGLVASAQSFYDGPGTRYIIWGTKGQYWDEDTKTWSDGWKRCTTAALWVTERYVYGVISLHCLEDTVDFRASGFYLVRRTPGASESEKIPAVILDYKPAQELSEVRLWRAPNDWGYAPTMTRVATSWKSDETVRYCSFWPTIEYYERVCGEGRTMAPGPSTSPYMSVLTDEVLGNMVFSGPAYWGFSGGPIFLGDAVVGIVNGFSLFSNLNFAWGLEPGIVTFLEREMAAPTQGPQQPKQATIGPQHYPSNFDQWDDASKAQWEEALKDNVSYELVYNSGEGYSVIVNGHIYRLPDWLAVISAILDGKIRSHGFVLDVEWALFVVKP